MKISPRFAYINLVCVSTVSLPYVSLFSSLKIKLPSRAEGFDAPESDFFRKINAMQNNIHLK